jgi:hypothetical protein
MAENNWFFVTGQTPRLLELIYQVFKVDFRNGVQEAERVLENALHPDDNVRKKIWRKREKVESLKILQSKKNIFEAFVFLSTHNDNSYQVLKTALQCIHKYLQILHPGGIRTRDLVFWRRTR